VHGADAYALEHMSPLLASRLQSLIVWYGGVHERTLAGVLAHCSALQTLTFENEMSISYMHDVLSALSHPLHSVRHFTILASDDFEVRHARTVLYQLPALTKFTARVNSFPRRALALWAESAPNCELEVDAGIIE